MITIRVGRIAFAAASLVGLSPAAVAVDVDEAAVERARAAFIERVVAKHAFDRAELTQILGGATIQDRVLELISRPAERVVPWHEYRAIFLNRERIDAGVRFWRQQEAAIDRAAAAHGVDPSIIVAIIGIETLFGQRMGTYRVLDSLSTLAFAYPPRSSFFASELEAFLLMSREEGADVLEALGSYAGAMGAGQFIPSSFRAYAVDGNSDGRRDLWTDWDDVLASVANYFKAHRWRAGETVTVPAVRDAAAGGAVPANGLDLNQTGGSIRALGFEFEADVADETPARVLSFERDAASAEYWVAFHNFHVITRYNRSEKYALAAHQLSLALSDAFRISTGQAAR
jgi:membrane-bound lytic murein transglycosylase B